MCRQHVNDRLRKIQYVACCLNSCRWNQLTGIPLPSLRVSTRNMLPATISIDTPHSSENLVESPSRVSARNRSLARSLARADLRRVRNRHEAYSYRVDKTLLAAVTSVKIDEYKKKKKKKTLNVAGDGFAGYFSS